MSSPPNRDPRAADLQATGLVREFHPRLARVADSSPELADFSLSAAQLVIARQYGFASWNRLRQHAEVVIRPVASPRQLGPRLRAHRRPHRPALAQDRRLLDLARRFRDDRPFMLIAEFHGQLVGVAFAFHRHGLANQAVTLRNVTTLPPHHGDRTERRLVDKIE